MKEKDNEKSNSWKKIRHNIIEDLTYAIVVLVGALLLFNFVLMNAYVPSESMEDTFQINDRIIGNRLAYKFGHDPERFDIVIFKAPEGEEDYAGSYFVKRVIGLPGEKVTIKDNQVYINDSKTPLDSSFTKEAMSTENMEFQVPAGCYFMLGDNRNESFDSRYWSNPYIPKDDIIAKVVLKYWKGFQLM